MTKSRAFLALTLCATMITVGCTANWIKTALADLPVLTQMGINIATLVTTLQSGHALDPQEAAAIQAVSAEATRDLSLLDSLYQQYKANPSADTLAKIQGAISEINSNLVQLLAAAHVSNPDLSARVTAAVNLILVTVDSFAALLPNQSPAVSARSTVKLPQPSDLKGRWNKSVCTHSGNASLDGALDLVWMK
jgi:hypothetical protein